MASTNINIRIDEQLKIDLQDLTSKLGLDVTTFFIMAAKQAIREQALPFTPSVNSYNFETEQAKWEIEFMKAHPELPWKTHDNASDLFAEILEEDEI